MKSIFILIFMFLIQNMFGQGIAPENWGLKKFQIKDAKLGDHLNVVFMSKSGTPFCDAMIVEEINPMKNLEEL